MARVKADERLGMSENYRDCRPVGRQEKQKKKKRVNMQLVVCIRRCTGGVYGHGAMSQHGQTASAPFANRQPCVRQELQQGPPHS